MEDVKRIIKIVLGILVLTALIYWFAHSTERLKRERVPFRVEEGESLVVIHFVGVTDPNIPLFVSVEDLEYFLGIEVIMPTIRELQEWCARHDVNVPIDGFGGTLTDDGMDQVRCTQEAIKHYQFFRFPTEKFYEH